MVIDRKSCGGLQIADQIRILREPVHALIHSIPGAQIGRGKFRLCRFDLPAESSGGTLEIEEQIQDPAKQGEYQHQHDPGGLECTLVPPGGDVDRHGEARQGVNGANERRISA